MQVNLPDEIPLGWMAQTHTTREILGVPPGLAPGPRFQWTRSNRTVKPARFNHRRSWWRGPRTPLPQASADRIRCNLPRVTAVARTVQATPTRDRRPASPRGENGAPVARRVPFAPR